MRTTQNILAENSKEMYLYEHLCLEKNKIKIQAMIDYRVRRRGMYQSTCGNEFISEMMCTR